MKTKILGLMVLGVLTVPMPAQAISIVISQIYGGGGNSGATYTNDYVELFNAGTTPVSLAGFSLQYASATGSGNFGSNPVNLFPALSLDPGQYFLVQAAAGAGGTDPLPTPDSIWTASLSATSGKVVLVNGTAGLACNGGSTPCSPAQLALMIDLVGYGSANFFEGAPAPVLTNTTAAFRLDGGCTDTNNNSSDFVAGTAYPNARNSSSPRNVCSAPPKPTPEPASLALLGLGLAGLGLGRKRRAS